MDRIRRRKHIQQRVIRNGHAPQMNLHFLDQHPSAKTKESSAVSVSYLR